jgi:hypothetical protein
MKSNGPGKSTSKAEVQNISHNGIWLLAAEKEYFLPYKTYPWFKKAKIAEILNVKLLNEHHLHWKDLDVDLEIESLQNPDQYPLKYE